MPPTALLACETNLHRGQKGPNIRAFCIVILIHIHIFIDISLPAPAQVGLRHQTRGRRICCKTDFLKWNAGWFVNCRATHAGHWRAKDKYNTSRILTPKHARPSEHSFDWPDANNEGCSPPVAVQFATAKMARCAADPNNTDSCAVIPEAWRQRVAPHIRRWRALFNERQRCHALVVQEEESTP